MQQPVGCGRLVGFTTAAFVLGLVLKALAQVGVRRLAVQTLEWTDTGAPRP